MKAMIRVLNEEEKDFIHFWETEGERRKRWTFMLKKYLPKGLIFSLPIGLFFFMMGYKRRALVTHSELTIIMVCIFIIAVFYAIFKGHVEADRSESYYQILKMKEEKNNTSATFTTAIKD